MSLKKGAIILIGKELPGENTRFEVAASDLVAYLTTKTSFAKIIIIKGGQYDTKELKKELVCRVLDFKKDAPFLFVYIGHGAQNGMAVDGISDNAISYDFLARRLRRWSGSTLGITIIDACYSGSAAEAFQNHKIIPSQGLLLCSSLATEKSFGSQFTIGLIGSWGKQELAKPYLALSDNPENHQHSLQFGIQGLESFLWPIWP